MLMWKMVEIMMVGLTILIVALFVAAGYSVKTGEEKYFEVVSIVTGFYAIIAGIVTIIAMSMEHSMLREYYHNLYGY